MPLSGDVRRSQTLTRVPRVTAIMVHRFIKVTPETPMAGVAQQLLKRKVSWAAVVDTTDAFVGFVSAQGVLAAFTAVLHDEMPVGPAIRYLDPDTPELHEDTPLLGAMEAFVGPGPVVHVLPVLRDREIVGVVTRLDAVRAALDYFTAHPDLSPGTLYMSALRAGHEKPPY